MNTKSEKISSGLVARFFQGLENLGAFFPSLGKSPGGGTGFSKAWKTSAAAALALSMSLAAYGVTVDWRDPESQSGNWDGGGSICSAAGSYNSQWWYSGWGGDSSRNRADCYGNHQVQFNNNRYTTMSINGSWQSVNTLVFASGATTARTISDNGLNMYDAGAKIENNSTATHVFNSAINLGVATQINPVNGDLTINGAITGDFDKSVYGANSKMLTLGGVVSGTGKLMLKQYSKVKISGASTYTGNSEISAGELWIATGGKLAQASTIYVGDGAALTTVAKLWLESGGVIITNPITINLGNADTRFLGGLNTSGTSEYRGNVTLNTNVNLEANDAGGSVLFGGVISGACDVNINQTGLGTVYLANINNTYSGRTIVQKGALAVGGDAALGAAPGSAAHGKINVWSTGILRSTNTFTINANRYLMLGDVNGPKIEVDSGKTLTYGGVMGGNAEWTKRGTGTLLLSGASTNNGALIISNGAVNVQNTTGLGLTAGGVTVISGAALEVQGASTAIGAEALALNGTGVSSGGGLRFVANNCSYGGTITLGSDASIVCVANSPAISGNIVCGANYTATITVDGTSIDYTGALSGTKTTGNGSIVKNGTGYLILRTGNNSGLTGDFNISAGEVRLGGANSMTGGGKLIMANGTALKTYSTTDYTVTKNLTINGNVTFGEAATRTGSITNNGTVDLGGATRTVTVLQPAGDSTDFKGVVSNGGLTKDGAGMLELSSANTYASDTTVTLGTLQLNASGVIPDGAGKGDVSVTGTLDMGGFSEGINGLSGGGTVDNSTGASTYTLTVGNDNDTSTFGGILKNTSGSLALTKAGSGTLTLTNINTLGGATTVSAGTLIQNGTNANSAVTVNSGAFLNGAGQVAALTISGRASAGGASNTVGKMTTAALNFQNNGILQVEYSAMSGTAGVNWDLVAASGALTVNAADGSDFVIALKGAPADFDNAKGWTNTIVTAASIASFATNKFTINTTEFSALGGGTFAIEESASTLRLVFTSATAPDISILGTNFAAIASGSTAPNAANGTDYGEVHVNGSTLDRTFFITNSGTADLTISGVTTSGVTAGNFSVRSWPGIVTAKAISNLVVRFDPTNMGLQVATISIANNVAGKNPYTFNIHGTGTWPGVVRSPTAINISSTLGSAPAASAFGVTNVGYGTMAYAIATNAGWLTVSPVSGSLILNAGQQHSVTFAVVPAMQVGTSNATITITDANASNSPATVAVAWTINAIANPSAGSATADGKELIRLNWAKNASYDVMIVHRVGSASTAPAQGTPYNVGDACGSGVVIYKGSGAYLEHIVAAGQTHHYAFYSYNGNYYSSGATASATLGSYATSEIVCPFAYTNGLSLNGLGGSNGWSGAWSVGAGTWTIQTNVEVCTFLQMPAYPTNYAYRVKLNNPGNDGSGRAERTFPAVNTGKIYAAAIVAYNWEGANKYAGLSFVNGGVETGFVGKIHGAAFYGLGISTYDAAGSSTLSSPEYYFRGLENSTNNTYLVIARYDFGTKQFSAIAYSNTVAVPSTEPGTWAANVTLAGTGIASIDGLRLTAGATAGGAIGDCYFDEARVARSWKELLIQVEPTWDGNGANANWDTAANWVGDTVPAATTNVAFYDGIASGAGIPVNGAMRTVNGLRFNDSADISLNLAYDASAANNLTINGGGIAIGSGSGGSHSVDYITLGANQTWTNESAQTFSVTNRLRGAGNLTKTGSGLVVLNYGGTASDFSGTLTINNGVLRIGKASSLGGTAAGTVVASGCALELSPGSGASYAAEPLTLSGHGISSGGALRSIIYNNSWAGAVTLAAAARISADANTLTLTGGINGDAGGRQLTFEGAGSVAVTTAAIGSNVGNVIKDGAGTFTLSFASTYSGLTIVSNGTFALGADDVIPNGSAVTNTSLGTLSVANNDTIGSIYGNGAIVITTTKALYVGADNGSSTYGGLISGNIADDGGYLGKTGTGTLTLTNVNTFGGSATGGVRILEGTLSISTIAAAGTAQPLGQSTAADAIRLGSSGKTGKLQYTGAAASSTKQITLETSGTGEVEVTTGGVALYLSGAISGSGAFIKSGSGILTNGGVNTFSGPTYVNAGTLVISGSAANSAHTVASGALLMGMGTIGNLSVSGTVNPGNIINTSSNLPCGDVTLGTAGAYRWEIANVAGTAGTHWDLITSGSGAGTITVNATAVSKFTIYVWGNPAGFSPSAAYTWKIIDGGSLSGFDTAKFTIDTSNFTPAFTGTWSLQDTSGDLELVYTPPAGSDIAVAGTNFAIIASGSTAPTPAAGTDYSEVHVNGSTLSRTFFITNAGAVDLLVAGVTTSGAAAADFTILSNPSKVTPGTQSNLVVRFDPSALGLRVATLSVTNDAVSKSPYTFNVHGTGVWPGVVRSPTAINVSSTLGSAPAASAFGVTNVGYGTMVYAITTNASWLTVSPVSGSLGLNVGQQHTVTFAAVPGMQAGTSNATIAITDANASNSPATVAVAWTISPIANPSGQSATADGKDMVRLAWTKDGSYDVMIVHRVGSASTAPTQGTAYNVGDACGSGVVVYKGNAAKLEHIVASGQTHYYAFYSYNGNYYSSGATSSATLEAYRTGEIVCPFAYTNGISLNGLGGSNGWSGAWSVGAGTFTVETNYNTTTVPYFPNMPNYPTNVANRVKVSDPGNNSSARAERSFPAIASGKIYASVIMGYQWKGVNKWSGISLMSNTTEMVFAGKVSDETYAYALGLSGVGGKVISSPEYQLMPFGEAPGDTGKVWLVIVRYDFSTRELSTKAYYRTDSVPTSEPGTWDATDTLNVNDLNSVSGVRIHGGCSEANTIGIQYFDEVRVAATWSDLLGVVPSKPFDPASATVTGDGAEMARLEWAKNVASDSVMILHKASAIGTDPTDGTSYSEGNTIGGATVIYKGSATKLEHVVAPGSSAYYKFYSYNGGNYYSTGLTANVSLSSYSSYEILNPFAYTNGVGLGSSQVGGQGFTGGWTVDSGTWTAQTNYSVAVADNTPRFFNMTNYPNMAGNLVVAADPGNNGKAKAQRTLSSAINSGTFYIAFMMSYQARGADKWAGVSLFNGGTEKAFFGKGAGANWSTLGLSDGTTTYFSGFDMGQFNSSYGDTGNVYMVVGKYDFGSKLLQAKAWRVLNYTFPDTEPGSWDVSQTLGTGIDSIDRIKLNIGSSDAGASIGKVFFDEVRIGTNWSQLLSIGCPTWVGSNKLGSTWSYLGDSMNFECQTFPIGMGQNASLLVDFAKTGAWQTNGMAWMFNANNNSYWSNRIQLTQSGVITSMFAAAGSACTAIATNNPAVVVSNIPPPTAATAAVDAVNTNSQINLEWTQSSFPHDVLVLRRTSNSAWPTQTQGQVYNAGDYVSDAIVVYRGAATAFNDTGLSPSTTYYYRFYSENYSYYSVAYDTANATTAPGGKTIVIDGNPVDWVGSAPTVKNSAQVSLQEFIWTDKKGESRTEVNAANNSDISEFRVYADADFVYFLTKLTNISDNIYPYLGVGVDTRRSSSSTGMDWLGDDSGLFAGSDYFGGGLAAVHYAERQMNVHYAGATNRIEVYADGGSSWYAPALGGNTNVAISAAYGCLEWKVARADLNLTGSVTGRFTIASFINTGSWNNDADATLHLADNTADAADAASIAPWNTPDNDLSLSSWQEDISDNDIDFFFDVVFNASGLVANQAPSVPALVTPTNGAMSVASPDLVWNASTDTDGALTGYLLEVSTNDAFNGVTGTENGGIVLRVNLAAGTTNYALSTTVSQYWWRVRSRDTAGELSVATTRSFRVVGKLDTEGPMPELMYIGTNVAGFLAGEYNAYISKYGWIQSVTDKEIRDTNNNFGFVIRLADASGVYATNKMKSADSPPNGAGGFAWNIVDFNGRVSPNWDLFETNTATGVTREWGYDDPFYGSNVLAQGNTAVGITCYVARAFNITNYDENIEYYLTVSAEDAYTLNGSWWSYGSWPSFASSAAGGYSGWCDDGPNSVRNITTNYLIRIRVTDDDTEAPRPSTNVGWSASRALSVSNSSEELGFTGTGLEALFTTTDGAFLGQTLSFTFNVYDRFYKGIQFGTAQTITSEGRTLTNTSLTMGTWLTNNTANFSASRSDTADTTDPLTKLAWYFGALSYNDMTGLWGDTNLSGSAGVTNAIQLQVYDPDNDRDGDQASQDLTFGHLQITDDDPVSPVVGTNPAVMVAGTAIAPVLGSSNLLAAWNFNVPDALVSYGVGAMTSNFTTSVDYGTGTTSNRVAADAAGSAYRVGGGAGLANNGKHLQFEIDMGGYQDLIMSFAVYKTATGFNSDQVSYSTDGSSFTSLGGAFNPATSWEVKSFDFSSIVALNRQPRVFIRITLSGASDAGGNNYFDNVQFNAAPLMFYVKDGQLRAASGAAPLTISFNAWDVYSGLARATAGLSNLNMSIEGYVTNNVANYDSSRSTAAATSSSATSSWSFTSFDYDRIGAMYADGQSNRLVRASFPDADYDRAGDSLWASNESIGYLRIVDDDSDLPVAGADLCTLTLGGSALTPTVVTQLIAGWNFNATNTAVAYGTGTLSSNVSTITFSSGSTINLVEGDVAGEDITITGSGNNGKYVQFSLSMSGYKNLVLTMAAQKSATGFIDNDIAYSINGAAFADQELGWNPDTSYAPKTVDFSGVSAMENTTSVIVRITLGGASTGNIRLDNVQFNAVPIKYFEMTDAQMRTVAAANPLSFSLNMYDTNSGLARATSGASNVALTVDGVLTNNLDQYDASRSAADSKATSSTSAWTFATDDAFGYVRTSDLYADGRSNRAIRATLADADFDRSADSLTVSNNFFAYLRVTDDDTNMPQSVVLNKYADYASGLDAAFVVVTNGGVLRSSDTIRGNYARRDGGSNYCSWALTDGDLANSGTLNMRWVFGGRDQYSGIRRSTTGSKRADAAGTNRVMSISLTNLISGNYVNYNSGLSSADATNATLTNVWTFADGFFTEELITNLMAATASGASSGMALRVTMPDADNDRTNDEATAYSAQMGFLRVYDNDANGPTMGAALMPAAFGGYTLFSDSFETNQGWTGDYDGFGSTAGKTCIVNSGTWITRGILHTSLDPKYSGTRRVGFLTNTFDNPWLQMPPVSEPGNVFLYARIVTTGSGAVTLRVERASGGSWLSCGELDATNTTAFDLLSWNIDLAVNDVTMRVVRVDSGGTSRSQVYMDDVSVTRRVIWTKETNLNVSWGAAVDDYHAVDEYRYLVPADTNIVPNATNAGTHLTAATTNILMQILQQGIVTGYVFSIDTDDDRESDRAVGAPVPIMAKVDYTPPTNITRVASEPGWDDTSEINLTWAPPDNGGGAGANPLSPWKSYRIFYEEFGTPTTNSPFLSFSNYAELATLGATNVVLSNLTFGTEYVLAMAGLDEAGNQGPISATSSTYLVGFNVTQGWAVATAAVPYADISWTAATNQYGVTREYDLIYVDAYDFTDSLTNNWTLIRSDYASMLSDTGSVAEGRANPMALVDQMRFYRAAQKSRWIRLTNQTRRVASEEVYVMKTIRLYPGRNWVAFPGIPDTTTVARTFGFNLPKGTTAGSAYSTKVEWYAQAAGATVTSMVWLCSSPVQWQDLYNNNANDTIVPLREGVQILIPTNGSQQTIMLIGRVPTNPTLHQVVGGTRSSPANNLVSFAVPYRFHPSQMKLIEAGFRGNARYTASDRLFKYDRASQRIYGAGVWYKTTDSTWREATSSTGPIITGPYFSPDDGIVIYSVNTNNWAWTNSFPYNAPTRYMTP